MTDEEKDRKQEIAEHLPSVEKIQRELGKAESIDDFFGKEGIFSRLFADAMETMLEAELNRPSGLRAIRSQGTEVRQQPQRQAQEESAYIRWRDGTPGASGPKRGVPVIVVGEAQGQQQ